MIAVISPAKNLDFETSYSIEPSKPRLLACTRELIDVMRKKSPEEVSDLMGISENLAELNVSRYRNYKSRHTPKNSKPAMYAFNGDVYQGLQASSFDESKIEFAQGHLRILSGLYGLLRPLDLMQPYRLEMGTKLAFDDYQTLYDYWDNAILKLLLKDLKKQGDNIIVNLASNEYFKSVNRKALKARVIDVEFKDLKNDQYKIISFYAKRARGLMARFMIENQISDPEQLKGFDYDGYYLDPSESTVDKLAFKRDLKSE
ncbi:MAG: peroxide stress protein YaaA [Cyclobacteriaceae bacterium]